MQDARSATEELEHRIRASVELSHSLDITKHLLAADEIHRERQWFESILHLMPMPLVLIEPVTARVIFANRAAEEMAGGEFPKFAPGDEYHNVYHCTDAQGRRIPNHEMPGVRVARGEQLRDVEIAWHVAGCVRHLLLYADTLPAMFGRDAVCVMLFQDIGHLKEVEQALRKASRQKDEFVATLGHELRNPLGSIVNAIELLGMDLDDSRQRDELLSMLRRQVGQLNRLVNDLHDISRIGRSGVTLERRSVELSTILRTVTEAMLPAAERAGHRLHVSRLTEEVTINVDPARIVQVLENLVDNAIKYTPRGGEITLTASHEGPHVAIHVRDTGIGIAADKLSHIFEMFARLETPSYQPAVGLGIGLALAQRLVEAHGGSIAVASEGPSQGTEFIVRLPCEDDPAESLSNATPAATLDVLVVEDSSAVGEIFARMLQALGHRVELATSSDLALARIRAVNPDVVFSDILMPCMTGLELAQQIRRDPTLAHTVLVAMTGYDAPEDRQRTAEAGFDHHLAKPTDIDVLNELLSSIGRRRRPR